MSLFALYNKFNSSGTPPMAKMGLQLQGFSKPHYFAVWPESIADSRSVDYIERNVVGSSHPIYQWTHSGSRNLSFEILLYQDYLGATKDISDRNGEIIVDGKSFSTEYPPLAPNQTDLEKVIATAKNPILNPFRADQSSELKPTQDLNKLKDKYNLGSRTVIQTVEFLRALTYPILTTSGLIKAPPPLYVGIWNSSGQKVLFVECVLRQVDVKFEAFFRNGVPRIATVNMSFSEITQNTKNWVVTRKEMGRMYGRSELYRDAERAETFDPKKKG